MNSSQHFFVIGAQKAGTTSLYRYLATHPDICGAQPKETKFFAKPSRSPKYQQTYESHFTGWAGERWTFEASPHYTQFPKYTGVPERIHKVFPDARLIYVVRHPIERIYSHYIFRTASPSGRDNKPFEEALAANPIYFDTSSYFKQLSQFLPLFPSERIHVLLSEDLARDPVPTLRKIFEFLEVDASFEPPNATKVYNQGKDRTTMVAPLVRRFKKTPFYGPLPWPVKRWIKRRLRVAAPTKADIFTPDSYNRIHVRLKDDVASLEAYLGYKLPWDFPVSKYS